VTSHSSLKPLHLRFTQPHSDTSKFVCDLAHEDRMSSRNLGGTNQSGEQGVSIDVNSAVSQIASALVISACEKAGMQGIDRSKIDAIILRESGNSLYMKQQRRRDEQVNKRIEVMLQEMEKKQDKSGGDAWKRNIERELEIVVNESIRSRPSRSAYCVVDMDMFYMACELLTRPELHDKPCCVGGGLVTTSNYVARKYGVRSAMAGFIADKLVEELSGGKEKLIHVPSNFALYTEKAHQVRRVLSEYDPNLKAYSLDEACLNIGPYVSLRLQGKTHSDILELQAKRHESKDSEETFFEDGVETVARGDDPLAQYPPHVALRAANAVVQEMRQRVMEATGGLTCSAGLAPNFMLAKIASDRNKPNGQLAVGPSHEEVLAFLHPLPVRKVGGIGRVIEKLLQALGVVTVQDLYQQRAAVHVCFKPATAKFLLRAAVGCSSAGEAKDDDGNDEGVGRKGISRERTFASGRSWNEITEMLENIARKLAEDMQSKNLWARTITLKVKLHTFDVMSRSRTLLQGDCAHHPDELVLISSELLKEVKQHFKGASFSVRLLGIRCSNFQGEQERSDTCQMNIKQYFMNGNGAQGPSNRSRIPPVLGGKQQDHAFRLGSLKQVSINGCRKVSHDLPWTIQAVSMNNDTVHCPMCEKPFQANDNAGLNMHVDVCLNRPAVQAAAKEETLLAQPRKKQRLTDFFGGY
jgi:DNA polymerase kappa